MKKTKLFLLICCLTVINASIAFAFNVQTEQIQFFTDKDTNMVYNIEDFSNKDGKVSFNLESETKDYEYEIFDINIYASADKQDKINYQINEDSIVCDVSGLNVSKLYIQSPTILRYDTCAPVSKQVTSFNEDINISLNGGEWITIDNIYLDEEGNKPYLKMDYTAFGNFDVTPRYPYIMINGIKIDYTYTYADYNQATNALESGVFAFELPENISIQSNSEFSVNFDNILTMIESDEIFELSI